MLIPPGSGTFGIAQRSGDPLACWRGAPELSEPRLAV